MEIRVIALFLLCVYHLVEDVYTQQMNTNIKYRAQNTTGSGSDFIHEILTSTMCVCVCV